MSALPFFCYRSCPSFWLRRLLWLIFFFHPSTDDVVSNHNTYIYSKQFTGPISQRCRGSINCLVLPSDVCCLSVSVRHAEVPGNLEADGERPGHGEARQVQGGLRPGGMRLWSAYFSCVLFILLHSPHIPRYIHTERVWQTWNSINLRSVARTVSAWGCIRLTQSIITPYHPYCQLHHYMETDLHSHRKNFT